MSCLLTLMAWLPLPDTGVILEMAGPPVLMDTRFYRKLLKKKRCTNDDGLRILLAFLEGGDKIPNPVDRLVAAGERGLYKESWTLNPDDELGARTFAYMLCRALGIKGGLSARVFGMAPRFAYRECVSLRLMRANGEGRTISGDELLSIMARAEEYRKKKAGRKEK